VSLARTATLLALAVVTVGFVVTWLTVPSANGEASVPASLFAYGLTSTSCVEFSGGYGSDPPRCVRYGPPDVVRAGDLGELKQRIAVAFGGAAVVVILIGLAFGSARREGVDT
jgi:hypothetical protein